jgi:hypothetical protein
MLDEEGKALARKKKLDQVLARGTVGEARRLEVSTPSSYRHIIIYFFFFFFFFFFFILLPLGSFIHSFMFIA